MNITLPRATVEQALEAMRRAVPTGKITLYEWDKAMAALRAALAEDALDRLAENERALGIQMEAPRATLAQQAEPLTVEWLRDALVASRIIPPAAVEDPDGYDDGATLFRIEALHRRIT